MTDFSAAQKLLESTNLTELCKKVGSLASKRIFVGYPHGVPGAQSRDAGAGNL